MGQAGGLETALQVLQKGNVEMGFLKETKLAQGIHTQNGAGYNVWAMEAESLRQGVVTVVWIVAKGWQVEGMDSFGPNVVIFLLISR